MSREKISSREILGRSGAIFSPSKKYRYVLKRQWQDGDNFCMFICLNPSTADENKDDPTVRKIINYAKRWGFDGVFVLNLFAYRSTDKSRLKYVEAPIGFYNDDYLKEYINKASQIIVAWGRDGRAVNHHWERLVKCLLPKDVYCLGINKDGTPKHPLYLSDITERRLYKNDQKTDRNEGKSEH